jgi:hypothetical protein
VLLKPVPLSLLAAAALFAQDQPPSKPGSLEGVVLNTATRAPVPKATVSFASGASWPERNLGARQFSRVATTDENGKFRVGALDPGAYHVEYVQAPGYMYENSRSAPITLAEDQRLTGIVLELMPLGAISGQVLDSDGEPLPFAQIAVMQYRYSNGVKSLHTVDGATTDDRGRYRVFRLPPGHYFVNAWLPPGQVRHGTLQSDWLPANTHRATPELGYVPVFFPNGADASQATAVSLAPGGDTGGIDFRLRGVPVYHIRGKLSGYDPAGPPASVLVAPCPAPDGAAEYGAKIQPDGRFDVSGVAAGAYCLTLTQSGDTRTLYAAETAVTLTNRSLDAVALRGMPAFAVPGVVRVEGPPTDTDDVIIFAEPVASAITPNTALVENARFSLEASVPGKYRIRANRLPPNMYLKSVNYGERDLPDQAAALRPGGAVLTVILGGDAGQVNGAVHSDGGEVSGNVVISVERDGESQWSPVDFGSHFLVPNLAPGDYKIYAWDDPDPSLTNLAEFRQEFSSRAVSVTVNAGAAATVELKLIPADEIRKVKQRYR